MHFALFGNNLSRAGKYSVQAAIRMCEACNAYFGLPVGNQDKSWALHFVYDYCKKILQGKVPDVLSDLTIPDYNVNFMTFEKGI